MLTRHEAKQACISGSSFTPSILIARPMATVIELSDSDDDKPSQTASISKPGLSKAATSNTPKRSNSSSSTEQAKSKAKNPFSYGFTPILPEDEVLLDDDEVGSSSSATAKNNSNGNAQTSNASKPEQSRKRKQPDSPVVANPKKKQKSAAPRSLGTCKSSEWQFIFVHAFHFVLFCT